MILHNYNIIVQPVETDDGSIFEARIRELPDVVEYAETFNDAYELAIDTIKTTAEAFAEAGRSMPGECSSTLPAKQKNAHNN